MPFCIHCGEEVPEGTTTCPVCGREQTGDQGLVGPEGADLRPLAIGEIVDAAIKLYREHGVTLLKVVAIIVVPIQIVSALIGWSLEQQDPANTFRIDPDGTTSFDGGDVATAAAAGILVFVLGIVGTQLATGASLKAVSDAYLGRSPEWGPSIEFALGRLGALIWLQVLFALAVFGLPGVVLAAVGVVGVVLPPLLLLFIFLIPAAIVYGVWFGVSWQLGVPALLVEDVRGTAALRRSFQLVKGRFWPVFGAIVLGYVIAGVVRFVLGLVFGLMVGFGTVALEPGSGSALVANLLTGVIGETLVTPFLAAVIALVYFDQRVRKEGFDLEVLAAGLDEGGTGLPPSPEPGPDDGPEAETSERDEAPPGPPPPDPAWKPDESGGAWEPHRRPPRGSGEG